MLLIPDTDKDLFKIIITFLLLLLSACAAIPDMAERRSYAQKLADGKGWVGSTIQAEEFLLQVYAPVQFEPAHTLTIYIEGDGLAGINTTTPSFNPTPVNPLALKLALRDDTPAVYLARPCQYVSFDQSTKCNQKYWTGSRFAPEVVSAMNRAIDQLKLKFTSEKIIMVGYSGGGALAALVAAKRDDVEYLITIAGNLDHVAWTRRHQLTQLTHSLNAADYSDKLQNIRQIHYVGGKDRVVGEFVARSYAAKFANGLPDSVIVLPDFDHDCCWEMYWPELIRLKKQ